MHLENGSRIIIVGGGPAGSFSALHLIHYAAQANLQLDIQIFEGREFKRPGPNSCNKCAGIISSTLSQNLSSLGLELPPEVIQAELTSYTLHLNKLDLLIQQPNPDRRIYSVYRGSGPRLGKAPYPAPFDNWLLEQARQRGANIQPAFVHSIRPGPRPVVITSHDSIEADLVIMATGVNSSPPIDPGWGYQPPRTETMAQDEVRLPRGFSNSNVHIFFDYPSGLIFGGLIPKGKYLNISLLGHKLSPRAVEEFLGGPQLGEFFSGEAPLLCGCAPCVAVSPAQRYYANRLVTVGDAAVTRLYKDGIGAAFITARAAAQTAIQYGISRQDFAAGYRPVCREIAMDNLYGKLLFRVWNIVRNSPRLLDTWQRVILAEADSPPANHIFTRILWGMFTGDEPYRKIFWSVASKPALQKLWLEVFRRVDVL